MSYTSPNWKNSILVTIDTQNDFTLPDAPAKIEGTLEVIPRIKELLNTFRQNNLPILHVIRLYKEDGSNVDICRREAIEDGLRVAAPNTEGAELVNEITSKNVSRLNSALLFKGDFQQIGNDEWVMYKSRWGAFYNTNLEKFLHNKNIDTIVFCGCNFPNCPRTTIYEASERDFRIVMGTDAISQVYQKGIEEMRNIGVNVLNTSDIVELLNKQQALSR
jgi:nicotinamidase-related amidase